MVHTKSPNAEKGERGRGGGGGDKKYLATIMPVGDSLVLPLHQPSWIQDNFIHFFVVT